jgi:hypothetical protein
MPEPKVLRASRPPVKQQHSVGHHSGLHLEDTPYHTTQTQSRKPVRITYSDNQDDDVYTERRMPTLVKKYTRSPVTTQTRIQEERYHVRVTPLRFFIIALGVILLALALALAIISFLMPALNRWSDDRTYGYPRTTHTRVNIGHGTVAEPYTDFTGENINGYIYVFELEETDPSQKHPQVYFITRYTGASKDLIAIMAISFVDENGDGKLDMLVTMENGSTFVLYNNGQMFTATASK